VPFQLELLEVMVDFLNQEAEATGIRFMHCFFQLYQGHKLLTKSFGMGLVHAVGDTLLQVRLELGEATCVKQGVVTGTLGLTGLLERSCELLKPSR